MERKVLPIGYSDFKKIIDNNLYYVDKTKIIEELLENKAEVVLFPRPRRFGKSLLLSTLNYFFDIVKKEENKYLFDNLYIGSSEYIKYQGNYPVIKIDLKELKQNNYNSMYSSYKELVREMFNKKKYLLDSLDEKEINIFNRFLNKEAYDEEYGRSIYILSDMLYRYHNKKVVILIDEYDVPIQQGYLYGFYDEILSLIKNVFSSALKGNENLEMAVLTGVLRVSKESLFSDLNNIKVYGIVDEKYNQYFGFTEEETKQLLEYYDLELTSDVKTMYDGYNFGGLSIYNPWSIVNYASDRKLIAYWVNTSGNELIKDIISKTSDNIKIEIESIIQGEEKLFRYDPKVTYLDLSKYNSINTIMNFWLTSGYLTLAKNSDVYTNNCKCVIPNKEVEYLFYDILEERLLDNNVDVEFLNKLQNAIINCEKVKLESLLNKNLDSLSFYDTKESFYHGFILGMFRTFINDKYIVKSNREAGSGRFDLMIESKDRTEGYIFEFKIAEKDMEKEAEIALNQMKDKAYYKELELDKVKSIYEFAIVFKGKDCIVR